MTTFIFSITWIGSDPDQYIEALYHAGCNDATFSTERTFTGMKNGYRYDGFHRADFHRKSATLADAVASALTALTLALPAPVEFVRIEFQS